MFKKTWAKALYIHWSCKDAAEHRVWQGGFHRTLEVHNLVRVNWNKFLACYQCDFRAASSIGEGLLVQSLLESRNLQISFGHFSRLHLQSSCIAGVMNRDGELRNACQCTLVYLRSTLMRECLDSVQLVAAAI